MLRLDAVTANAAIARQRVALFRLPVSLDLPYQLPLASGMCSPLAAHIPERIIDRSYAVAHVSAF